VKIREWLKKNRMGAKIFSLLLAITLWVIVIQTDNPERTVEYEDIPVQLIGSFSMTSNRGLVVSAGGNSVVDLRIRSSVTKHSEVSEDDVKVRVDLTGITEPGTYELEYDVSLPDGVVIAHREPAKISVTIEEVIEKELEIKVNLEGKINDSLEITEAIVDPLTATVSGVRSVVEKAAYAEVTVKFSDLTDTYEADLDYVVTDADGKVVDETYLVRKDETIHTLIPVYMRKSVPLMLELTDAIGVTGKDAVVNIKPTNVEVIGSVTDVSALEFISLGTVDLSDFELTYDATLPVPLPENLQFVEDPGAAEIHISFKNVETTMVNVSNIELINAPEELDVTLESRSVIVTIRGKKDALKTITADRLAVQVDLSGVKLKTGRQLAKAKVVVTDAAAAVDVLGEYSVILIAQETEA